MVIIFSFLVFLIVIWQQNVCKPSVGCSTINVTKFLFCLRPLKQCCLQEALLPGTAFDHAGKILDSPKEISCFETEQASVS
jgi:hypothetical protein